MCWTMKQPIRCQLWKKSKKITWRNIANLFREAISVMPVKNGDTERGLLSAGQSCVFANEIKSVEEIYDEIFN